jgi:hypothetical protein
LANALANGQGGWVDDLWTPGWVHSALLVIMIGVILTGRRGGGHESRRQKQQERAGLRAALTAELVMLRGIYRLNGELIAAGSPSLISGRAYFSVYRGNMQRLMMLTPAEVTAVVTAFAASEMLDSAVAVGNRMRSRHPEKLLWQAKRFDVKRLHRAARASAEEAMAALEEAGRRPPVSPARQWWQGLRTRLLQWRWRVSDWWDARRGLGPGGVQVTKAP